MEKLKQILIDLWNYLYRFLCYLTKQDPNEDYIVPPVAEDEEKK